MFRNDLFSCVSRVILLLLLLLLLLRRFPAVGSLAPLSARTSFVHPALLHYFPHAAVVLPAVLLIQAGRLRESGIKKGNEPTETAAMGARPNKRGKRRNENRARPTHETRNRAEKTIKTLR